VNLQVKPLSEWAAYAVGARAVKEATPRELWARTGQASDTRSAATAAYNARRMKRRASGTPGGGCAFRDHRRFGAKIRREPRSWRVARTRACPASWSWNRWSTLNKGRSVLPPFSQAGAMSRSTVALSACIAAVDRCRTAVTPSQLHEFAMPTNSANIHIARTLEVRHLR